MKDQLPSTSSVPPGKHLQRDIHPRQSNSGPLPLHPISTSTLEQMPFNEYVLNYSPGQNIWNKTERSRNWRGQEKLDIYFCLFFNWYCQSLICEGETGH